ncbi:hypothetical protein F511_35524 [Dorcoceras hygrometricum]|uniref:Uncharacterized protein n=1 Tax=Dorcoceras hygrometricum TaxID=472368 RepID=A0A2Z7CWF2_9LAMI|nr:hypothetical protein F511_35524 [Dorcoceras hygrometricum]
MAPRHERRSAAGYRCAHWLRDLPGVDAWRKLAVLVDAYRSPVAQRRARWPRERRRIAARLRRTIALRWPAGCCPSCAAGRRMQRTGCARCAPLARRYACAAAIFSWPAMS